MWTPELPIAEKTAITDAYLGFIDAVLKSRRHTGQWFRIYQGFSLKDAMQAIESNEMLLPL